MTQDKENSQFENRLIADAVERNKPKAEDVIRDPLKAQDLLDKAVEKANRRENNKGRLSSMWDQLKSLFRLLQAYIKGEYREISWGAILLITSGILYFLSPMDLIADIIPFAGFLDDATVIGFVVTKTVKEISKFLEWEKSGSDDFIIRPNVGIIRIVVLQKTEQKLTNEYVKKIIDPFLNAIVEFQHIIDQIQGLNSSRVEVISITQNSPVTIDVGGVTSAVQLIREIVVPERRRHIEKMNFYTEQQKQVEIQLQKAELLEKKLKNEVERLDLEIKKEEVKKMHMENEKLRLQLQQDEISMAMKILELFSPSLSNQEKEIYLAKILKPLNLIVFSELEIASIQNLSGEITD